MLELSVHERKVLQETAGSRPGREAWGIWNVVKILVKIALHYVDGQKPRGRPVKDNPQA